MNSRYCPVRHFVLVDFKRRHVCGVQIELIVPTEGVASARESQRRHAGWNFNHSMGYGRSDDGAGTLLRNFIVERQLVKHVSQRLDMHQPMLDRHIEQRVE